MKEILLHYFVLFLLPYSVIMTRRSKTEDMWKNLVVTIIFLSGMIVSFSTLWESTQFNFTIVICFLLILLFYRSLVYDQKLILIECLRQIYLSVLVALIVTAAYEIFNHRTMLTILQTDYLWHATIIYTLCVGSFLGIETGFEKTITSEVREFFFARIKTWHILLMINILIVKSTALLIILNQSNHSIVITYLFFVTTIVELFFCFLTIRYIAKMYHFSVFRYRHSLLDDMYQLQLSHLEQLEQKAREIRRLSHDIHNHKIVLHQLISEQAYGQALSYLDSFTDYDVQTNNQPTISEHRIINAMCQQKVELGGSDAIQFVMDLRIPAKLNIADFDLCVIFGNLFDNAIEAVKKCPLDQREIHVQAYLKNENFVLVMANDFVGELKQKNQRLVTSKQDEVLHGIGLGNVIQVVEKHGGMCNYYPENQRFFVKIRIPLTNL
ncbi:MAG: GHKL domain-containing protein [Culicoidibacterales bacterium]